MARQAWCGWCPVTEQVAVYGRTQASPLLLEEEAATYLRVSKHTLAKWRVAGTGPDFSRMGTRVVYEIALLDEFVARNRRKSTSDLVEAPSPTA